MNPYPGYVYVISAPNSSDEETRMPTKIGFCHEKGNREPWLTVYERKVNIERNHWQDLFIEVISPFTLFANEIENDLHVKYKKYKLKGEWFNLTEKQIKNIKKYLMKAV